MWHPTHIIKGKEHMLTDKGRFFSKEEYENETDIKYLWLEDYERVLDADGVGSTLEEDFVPKEEVIVLKKED